MDSSTSSRAMINSENREKGKNGQRPVLIQPTVLVLSEANFIHFLTNQEDLPLNFERQKICRIFKHVLENSIKAMNIFSIEGSFWGLAHG